MARWLVILLSALVMAASFTASSRERQLIAGIEAKIEMPLGAQSIEHCALLLVWESGGKTIRATQVASSHPSQDGFRGYSPRVSRCTVWMIEVAFDVPKRAVSAYCHGTA
jgi:hypothetical protein